ncbi:MAG: hypothetical protein WCX90_10710 [Thiohalomonadaceae bacterium]
MSLYKTLCVAVAFSLATVVTAASAETWRFGLEEIEGSVQAKYAEAFKDLIEEKSGGDITVQLLPMVNGVPAIQLFMTPSRAALSR